MPYVALPRPHYKILYACGHVKDECACLARGRNWKPTFFVSERCERCTAAVQSLDAPILLR